MSDSGDEYVSAGEEKVSTPKSKTPHLRPATRNIVRWTDELLIFAFAEFRQSAIRNHVDIKRYLEDAAKAISPHTTADALVQQLTKRRAKLIKQRQLDSQASVGKPGKKALAGTPKKVPAALKIPVIKSSSAKRKATVVKKNSDSTIVVLESDTPTSETFDTPRKSFRIKNEIVSYDVDNQESEHEIESVPNTPHAEEEHIESEYMESPLKGKNKRLPVGDESASKKAKATPATYRQKLAAEVVGAPKSSNIKKISEIKKQEMNLMGEDLPDPYVVDDTSADRKSRTKVMRTPRLQAILAKEASLTFDLPKDVADRYPLSDEDEEASDNDEENEVPARKLASVRKRRSVSPSKSRSRSPQKTPEEKKEYQRQYYLARKEKKRLESMSPPTLSQQFVGAPAPPMFGSNPFYAQPAQNFNVPAPVDPFYISPPGNGYMSSFPVPAMNSGVGNLMFNPGNPTGYYVEDLKWGTAGPSQIQPNPMFAGAMQSTLNGTNSGFQPNHHVKTLTS